MKEAAGEANMTVITIVLIAIVLGAGTIIVNNLMTNAAKKNVCVAQGGTKIAGTDCKDDNDNKICSLTSDTNGWHCN